MENIKLYSDFYYYNENIKNTYLIIGDYKKNISQTYELTFHYSLIDLHKKNKLNFITINELNIINIKDANFDFITKILLIRCKNKRLLNILKKLNKFTIYYMDDNLIIKPNHLCDSKIKNNFTDNIIKIRKNLLNYSNIIYVSTNYLKLKLKEEINNKNIYSNDIVFSFNKNLLIKNMGEEKKKNKFIIGYMGSKSHNEDIKMITNAIIKLLLKYDYVYFEIAGSVKVPKVFYENNKIKNRFKYYGSFSPYKKWINKLNSFQWDLGLAPCKINNFNNCKSPIKYIEYSLCNIPVIASNIDFYEKIIIDNYNGFLIEDYNWFFLIDNIISNKLILKDILKNSKQYCEENFSFKKITTKIYELLNM